MSASDSETNNKAADELDLILENDSSLKEFLNNLPKLDRVARKEFARIVNLAGVVNELDYTLLYDYTKAFSDVIRMEKEVEDEGELLESSKTGNMYINPRNSLLLNRRNSLSRLRKELNMSPKSRSDKTQKKVATLNDLVR